MSEAVAEQTELETAFAVAEGALRSAFPKFEGIIVNHSLSDLSGKGTKSFGWGVSAFCPNHFTGHGPTVQEAVTQAIAAGKKANATRCPTCYGIVGKCGHGDN